MKFVLLLLGYIFVSILSVIFLGMAGPFLVGFIALVMITIVGEVSRTNCKSGREQIRKEQLEQEKYENEFGIIKSKDKK